MRLRLVHTVTGLAVVAIGLVGLSGALDMRFTGRDGVPGPGFFPRILSVGLIVLGLLLVATRLANWPRPAEHIAFPGRVAIGRVAGVWLGFTASISLLTRIGLVPSTVLLIAFLLLVIERIYHPGVIAAIVLIPFLTYLLFVVFLQVQLPGFGGE